MQITSETRFVFGTFKKELKNRFLCEVQIENEDVICYVPSSCHLGNFLQLEGKRVLLVPTQTPKARTQYALFAVPYKRNYIILNTSMANRAIEGSVKSRRFAYLGKRDKVIKEHTIGGYKADLYLPKENTIIEIKSVISTEVIAKFPTIYSERTIEQLNSIYQLLKSGYKVCFIVVSLHPYVKEIEIDTDTEFYKSFINCIKEGLIIKSYTCRLKEKKIAIDKEISIKYKGEEQWN